MQSNRFFFVFFVTSVLLLASTNAMADIVYDTWPDDYADTQSEGRRYSYGYGYEQDYPSYSSYDSDYTPPKRKKYRSKRNQASSSSYSSRLPQRLSGGEKVILVDPNVHAWGAYSSDGKLIRSGIATAGSHYCRDLRRPCRTRAGTFRIYSMGDSGCYSRKFPLGRGGAPMPYCMYFNGGQGIHGSSELANANLSHGCVRIRTSDARWLRYDFAGIGTKVIVRSY